MSRSFIQLFFVGVFLAFAGASDFSRALRVPANATLTVEEEIPKWSPPFYGDQKGALGYDENTFAPPQGLEERVQFWKDIYTKYTSFQGVLHDSRYVSLVYGMVDFSDLEGLKEESLGRFEKEKEKRIDAAKKAVIAKINRLADEISTEPLSEEDQRLKALFNAIEEDDKFEAAKNRLRFQLGQKDIFIRGIQQSGHYIRQMETIFREEGLPIELTRLAFVESSFNLKAMSRVGASGIWQFMRSTAKLYLRMDSSVDERNDPLFATRAAARKLRSNYQMLESWPLAVTGYNHGAYGISRLAKKLQSKNIVDFVDFRKGSFGFASASFYASFLAALEVEKEAERYFGPIKVGEPVLGEVYRLKRNLSVTKLIELFDGDEERARKLNPHIRRLVWKRKGLIYARNRLRFDLRAEEKLKQWKAHAQFMFSTRAT
jgi:membrane-bound lytic murein transglycosylase D